MIARKKPHWKVGQIIRPQNKEFDTSVNYMILEVGKFGYKVATEPRRITGSEWFMLTFRESSDYYVVQ